MRPITIVTAVPNAISRRTASASLRQFLNAFPFPNGAALDGQAAEFRGVAPNSSSSNSGSFRVDHTLATAVTLFARYSQSASDSLTRSSELVSPNMLSSRDSTSKSVTLGATWARSARRLDDFRLNYSTSNSYGSSVMDDFGGAVPLTESQVFPKGVTAATGEFNLSILGVGGYSLGGRSQNKQSQFNALYSTTHTGANHTVKFGADVRRTAPTNYRMPYSLGVTFNGLSGSDGSLLSSIATNAQATSNLEAIYPVYSNYSAYGQDTWRAGKWTTLTYGVRWDINPAPTTRDGPKPFTLDASDKVTQEGSLYRTRLFDFAPRLGYAFNMDERPGQEMMLRVGIGLFYDVGYGTTAAAFSGAPYSNVRTVSLATFPLAAADAAPPVMPPSTPYGQITGASTDLKSPIVPQWNVTWERYFGQGQLLSLAYVATRGRRLLRTESRPSFSDDYEILRVATNGAESQYDALQVQFRRRGPSGKRS